jgi:hypothetical protein
MKIKEIESSYEVIKQIIDVLLNRFSVSYRADSDCGTMTYEAMLGAYLSHGIFVVYSGGDHGFLGEEYNIKFRALHDYLHYATRLSFSFAHERQLSRITGALFSNEVGKLRGNRSTVRKTVQRIIEAEIGGQIDYYEKHRQYVKDQKQFIIDYLTGEQNEKN